MADALRFNRFPATSVALSVPDIVWTLPEGAVTRVAPAFSGWKAATEALRNHQGAINPKDLLETRYGLRVNIPTLRRIIDIAREDDLPTSRHLKAAIASVISQSVQ